MALLPRSLLLFVPVLAAPAASQTWLPHAARSFELGSGLADGEEVAHVATGFFRHRQAADSLWLSDTGDLRWKQEEPYGIAFELRTGVLAVDVIRDEGGGRDRIVVLDPGGLFLGEFSDEADVDPTWTALDPSAAGQDRMWVVDSVGDESRILTQAGSADLVAYSWTPTGGLTALGTIGEANAVVDVESLAWPGLGRLLVRLYAAHIEVHEWGGDAPLSWLPCAAMKDLVRLDAGASPGYPPVETLVWLTESEDVSSVRAMSMYGVSDPVEVANETGVAHLARVEFDGSGSEDLVVLDGTNAHLRVLTASGKPWTGHPFLAYYEVAYTQTSGSPATELAHRVSAADLDADGDGDWLLAQEDGGLTVLRNASLIEDCLSPGTLPGASQLLTETGFDEGGRVTSIAVSLELAAPIGSGWGSGDEGVGFRVYVEAKPDGTLAPEDPLGAFIRWEPTEGVVLPATVVYGTTPGGDPYVGTTLNVGVSGLDLVSDSYRVWALVAVDDGSTHGRLPWNVISLSNNTDLAGDVEQRVAPDLDCGGDPGDEYGDNNGGRFGSGGGG